MTNTSHKLHNLLPTSQSSISAECPTCGKHSIVETGHGQYRCLGCNFSRDFADTGLPGYNLPDLGLFSTESIKAYKSKRKLDGLDWFMGILVVFLILVALL
jgi:hypothetical protein